MNDTCECGKPWILEIEASGERKRFCRDCWEAYPDGTRITFSNVTMKHKGPITTYHATGGKQDPAPRCDCCEKLAVVITHDKIDVTAGGDFGSVADPHPVFAKGAPHYYCEDHA